MAAPVPVAAEAPFSGSDFGHLYEEVLNERGATDASLAYTDSSRTSASASMIAQAKKCVLRSLSYLQACRLEWFPLSEDSATAVSDYSRVLLPTDFGSFGRGGAFVAGVRLQILTPEMYAANVRPTADGGGVSCADVSGTPTHARLVLVPNTEASIVYYRWALEVYPVQAAAWTARVIYNSTAKGITTATDIVRVPVVLQSVMEDLSRAEWRRQVGDAKGAAEFMALVETALANIPEMPGDQTALVAKSAMPAENAGRWS